MKLAHQPARMHHAATLSPPPSTSCAYFPSLRGGCTLCALIAPVSAISVLLFFPSSSAQPLCFLSHPCNPSIIMRLRTLFRNGTPLSLLFSMASALFLSPQGWYPPPASTCLSVVLSRRPADFGRPLFSYSYKSLFPQALSFHIHA